MRWTALLLAGCRFSPGTVADDNRADSAVLDVNSIDAQLAWQTDPTSHKAVPASRAEWLSLIEAKGLEARPPDDIWQLQDQFQGTAPMLVDANGSLELGNQNSNEGDFYQPVTGWDRKAIAASNNGNVSFGVFDAAAIAKLPDISTTSMTLLAYYATATPATQQSSIMFEGRGVSFAEVGIDTMQHLTLSFDGELAAGTVDHGHGVIPIVLKIDHANTQIEMIADHEIISVPFKAPGATQGLLLGGANKATADSRWLYLALWTGSSAEMTDAQINALEAALGW